jgi:hypothetical protein
MLLLNPSLPATNAKRLRKGAQRTKQSILLARMHGLLRRSLSPGAQARDPVARNDNNMGLIQWR